MSSASDRDSRSQLGQQPLPLLGLSSPSWRSLWAPPSLRLLTSMEHRRENKTLSSCFGLLFFSYINTRFIQGPLTQRSNPFVAGTQLASLQSPCRSVEAVHSPE